MAATKYVQAFAEFGATPKNSRTSVSALTSNNELVIALWENFFKKGGMYEGSLDTAGSEEAKLELATHLRKAIRSKLPVQAVFLKPKNPSDAKLLTAGKKVPLAVAKEAHAHPELVGRVLSFDGNRFVIQFENVAFELRQ